MKKLILLLLALLLTAGMTACFAENEKELIETKQAAPQTTFSSVNQSDNAASATTTAASPDTFLPDGTAQSPEPTAQAPVTTVQAPATTVQPVTTKAPVTTQAPVTTAKAPVTTKAPITNDPPPVTQAPVSPDSLQVTVDPKVVKEGETFTGRSPLPAISFTVKDPLNKAGLSTERFNYSFGVAKDGKPHQISVDHQKYFDSHNHHALTLDNLSTEKVLYLTFDCGYEYQGITGDILDVLKEKNVHATFFCTLDYLKSDPQFVVRMIDEGHTVGNHSTTHPIMPEISKEKMAKELLGVENYLRVNFGYSSPYFRFPTGAYSDEALELCDSLGFRSIFWSIAHADWDPANQPGKQKAYDTITSRLHPGATILLHAVSRSNADALADIIDYAQANGYVFRSLDEYKGW